MLIGLISDTHGLLREEVAAYLKGSDLILHAGDVNKPEILEALRQIAPLKVVRGNNDKGEWAMQLPLYEDFILEGLHFYMVHQKKDLPDDISPYDVVITGHSHRYHDTVEKGIHYLNPGSCGKRRFDLPITMALLQIEEGQLHVKAIDLNVAQ